MTEPELFRDPTFIAKVQALDDEDFADWLQEVEALRITNMDAVLSDDALFDDFFRSFFDVPPKDQSFNPTAQNFKDFFEDMNGAMFTLDAESREWMLNYESMGDLGLWKPQFIRMEGEKFVYRAESLNPFPKRKK